MIFIAPHLGLGDMLICNGIFQHYAAKEEIAVPCKHHNVPSVRPLRSEKWLAPVNADADVLGISKGYQNKLMLGVFSGKPFNPERWDSEFYRQAGVSFDQRWDGFKYPAPSSESIAEAKNIGEFAFVHEDNSRGFGIDPNLLPSIHIVRPNRLEKENIFDYVAMIQAADEIHCIESCFAILVDSIPTRGKLFLHAYARIHSYGIANFPHYRKNWNVLS